jgi:hypothetical protein
MYNISLIKMYELPGSVHASAETRRRYAEFARRCYANIAKWDIHIEKFNSFSEYGRDPLVHLKHKDKWLSLTSRTLDKRSVGTFIDKPCGPPISSDYHLIGILLPDSPSIRVSCAYSRDKEWIANDTLQISLEENLSWARSVHSGNVLPRYTYHPVRYPYVSDGIAYSVKNTQNYDYYTLYVNRKSFTYNATDSSEGIFYNPIKNRVEDWKGRPLI